MLRKLPYVCFSKYDFVATCLDCAFCQPILKNMIINLDHFPNFRGENQKIKTNTSFRNFYGFMFGSSMETTDPPIHPYLLR